MCIPPTITNSASTASFTITMMLFTRVLSRAPRMSNHVTIITMLNAGRFTSTGIGPMRGAVSSSAITAGSLDAFTTQYPWVIHPGKSMPNAVSMELK
jgi:hypothetical protein